MNKKIFISGMNSGPNPCSGVGICRSLKKAFPDLITVGVDHWQGSSGLHHTSVDETVIFPSWSQIDSHRHSQQIRSVLEEGHLWIPAMDMEVYWLSENLEKHPNLLAPHAQALSETSKPQVKAFEVLDFKVPEFISAHLPDSEIHSFLRFHSWRCWLKSPFHEATRITSWGIFQRARAEMTQKWDSKDLFIQSHRMGQESTIAFCAYQGELLGALQMHKRQTTYEGKAWAARVSQLDPKDWEQLEAVIQKLHWSGGGEIEFLTDPDGKRWIIECNPRFPAWIYGGTLCQANLPARLIARIWNLSFIEKPLAYPFFTRVVAEIPAKESIGIPLAQEPSDATGFLGEKGGKKGMPALVSHQPSLSTSLSQRSWDQDEPTPESSLTDPEEPLESYSNEIAQLAQSFEGESPVRVHLEHWTNSRFQELHDHIKASSVQAPQLQIGYSVKTSPTDEHLRKAKKYGFFAECISQMEVRRALDFGFSPREIILNGPGKFWPLAAQPATRLHMLFCDSIEEFEKVLGIPHVAQVIGFRIRLPKLQSRFGNPLDEFESFERLLKAIEKIKTKAALGFHFHMPSWAIGVHKWALALDSLLIWCQTLEHLSGVPVEHLDLGGGFFPKDLKSVDFALLQRSVAQLLPHVSTLYLEPGRSLTQEGEVLASRVLDVRRKPNGRIHEVVVDASIAELPLIHTYSHRIFYQQRSPSHSEGSFYPLKKGESRILGRICMEDDILSSGVNLPESMQVGDLVIFGDAGGYERSMSYGFGRG
ncbi:MAG: hypothetical protein ACO3A2_09915 [Bdellovibrionia bacterium]